jgi:hypothetical protein
MNDRMADRMTNSVARKYHPFERIALLEHGISGAQFNEDEARTYRMSKNPVSLPHSTPRSALLLARHLFDDPCCFCAVPDGPNSSIVFIRGSLMMMMSRMRRAWTRRLSSPRRRHPQRLQCALNA